MIESVDVIGKRDDRWREDRTEEKDVAIVPVRKGRVVDARNRGDVARAKKFRSAIGFVRSKKGMNPKLRVLNNVRIASPCTASWEGMRGDNKVRFCGQCEKKVYNLPDLDPDEIVSLIEQTEGKFCGRIHMREDGTGLTEDCPIGIQIMRRARRAGWVVTAAILAGVAALVGTMLGPKAAEPINGVVERIRDTPEAPVPMMGAVAAPIVLTGKVRIESDSE